MKRQLHLAQAQAMAYIIFMLFCLLVLARCVLQVGLHASLVMCKTEDGLEAIAHVSKPQQVGTWLLFITATDVSMFPKKIQPTKAESKLKLLKFRIHTLP